METITYSDARARLAKTMEKVCDDLPVVITRKNNRPVVCPWRTITGPLIRLLRSIAERIRHGHHGQVEGRVDDRW